jgi:multicomponent Na+:H+ antiporter subunit F
VRDGVNLALALFLVLNIAVAMVRVALGPSRADRVQAALLFGTMGIAVLMLLAEALDVPALRDVGLVLALLASIVTVAFVWRPSRAAGAAAGGRR